MVADHPPRLERGVCYVLERRAPDDAYRLFRDLARGPFRGIVITRQFPDRARQRWELATTRILWLSQTPDPGSVSPLSLDRLLETVLAFIDHNKGEAVVLLDGLEYLTVNNGFVKALMFLEQLNEAVARRKAITILPLAPQAFSEKELALFERGCVVLGEDFLARVPLPGKPPLLRFIPEQPGALEEAFRSRLLFAHLSSDVDDSGQTVEVKVRAALSLRVPFIILISGSESQTGIFHVLHHGRESWMGLHSLLGAAEDLR